MRTASASVKLVIVTVKARLLSLLRRIGIDRAVAFTVVGRAWTVFASPVTMLLIARRLSAVSQGFYYTFANVLGLQVFFELGLTAVILQFASHEKVALQWTPDGRLDGDERAKARLGSLLRLIIPWYGTAALLVVFILLPGGYQFFRTHEVAHTSVNWQSPWILVAVISAGNLLISPFFAFLEGCGKVAEVARVWMWRGVFSNLATWTALVAGWGLFTSPMLYGVGLAVGAVWLFVAYGRMLWDLICFRRPDVRISFRREVWPFQWRIAVSWLSGYFAFQVLPPILFAVHRQTESGRMGMTLNAITQITAIAAAWVTTRAPRFGELVVRRDYHQLDREFFRCMWQAAGMVTAICIAFWLAILGINTMHIALMNRLLAPGPSAMLCVAAILNVISMSQAIYLRAHKQEPLMVVSVLFGLTVTVISVALARSWGSSGMAGAYLLASGVVGVGMGTVVFQRKRREWHVGPDGDVVPASIVSN